MQRGYGTHIIKLKNISKLEKVQRKDREWFHCFEGCLCYEERLEKVNLTKPREKKERR